MNRIRVVHYLNQFFAQIGGEDKGDVGPGVKEGPLGPGRALQQALGENGEVVATIFCGDNYFAENQDEAIDALLRFAAEHKPDLLIAGPAFESGRYGVACGAICHAAQQKLSEAIIEYRNALERNPRLGEARYRLAEVYMKLNDLESAGLEYVRAAELMPERNEVQLKAGTFLLMTNRFEESQARAEMVLRRAPRDVDARILLGNALAGLKNADRAIAELESRVSAA